MLGAALSALDALDHPGQHAHVLGEARPDKLAGLIGAEPVDAEDPRQPGAAGRELVTQLQPVGEVLGHVVAAERQHRERIAPKHALRASQGSGGLAAHRGRHVHAFGPAARLGDQRHRGRAPATEHECVDRHALRIFPVGIDRRALARGHREARVRMRRLAAAVRRPVLALPVNQMRRRRAHALPPDVAVVGQRDIGEDDVAVEHRHRVVIGLVRGAGRHTEAAGLRIDRVQPAILAGFDPGDVLAHRGDLPAFKCRWRDQHREVGLAAGRREGRCHVVLAPLWRSHAEDQHVLGQPALVAAHRAGNAQREALLAQQRVAAVAGAEAPDLARLRKVNDVLGGIARPGHVLLASGQRLAHRMHAGHEVAVFAEHVVHGPAHTRHQPHVDRHVRAVGQLHADVRDVRTQRTHRERHHVHRATAHAAGKQAAQRATHLRRVHPVVGRTGLLARGRADEGAILDARHVRRIGPGQVGVRALLRVEPLERTRRHHLGAQTVVLRLGAVAPDHARRLRQARDLADPGQQPLVPDPRGRGKVGRSVRLGGDGTHRLAPHRCF